MNQKLQDLLIKHEGLRLLPYRDTVGKITIGVGRNLDDMGITREEAIVMLQNDLNRATFDAQSACPSFVTLTQARQDALVDMAFNLGLPRLLGFKEMLAAIQNENWTAVANEMLSSQWAAQVKERAQDLANMMRSGQYPNP